MLNSKTFLSPKAALQWSAVFWMSLLLSLGVCHAQSGSFIIPGIRANSGTDFAYWDLFSRPPDSSSSINYNYANPPALLGGDDDDGNPTTAMAPRATLIQNGAADAFLTSSGAIYSYAEIVKFEVPYQPAQDDPGEVTNVVFQTQTGGTRLNVNSVQLVYEQAGASVSAMPIYRGMDDPQSGAFSERIVCAFQWDLTGLNVRNFKIVFAAPAESMPLWQAQLDVVTGTPFDQELGYLLSSRSRPITRFGRAGAVDKNLPLTADGRFFMAGDQLHLLGDPESGWRMSGWHYNGGAIPGVSLPLVFPAQDITVTALFAPTTYAVWRGAMFYHANTLLGTANDHLDDEISAPAVDHDGDGLTNAGEYAFAGDPYTPDDLRTRPQLVMVEVESVKYPAIRYRTSGLQPGLGDTVHKVRVSANGGPFQDNGTTPTTVTMLRELQSDGSELVTERTVQPMSSFTAVDMEVAWSVDGVEGTPLAPAPLAFTRLPALAGGHVGSAYSTTLAVAGGMAPYTWSHTPGLLPAGLTINAEGVLAGVPTTAGSYSFAVQVTDSVLKTVTRTFSLEVAPFQITSESALAARMVGSPFNLTLASLGGTGPFTWDITAGTLPQGMTLSESGLLSGTPTATGDFQFTVEVEDAGGFTATKVFTWTVFDIQIVTAAPLPTAVVSFPYDAQLAATGGTGPYAWTLTAGSLPAELSLSNAGVISGTPKAAGSASFTVTVTDADNFSTTAELTLTVSAMVPAPVMNPVVFPTTAPGAEFSYRATAANYPKQFTIVGLPKGLKYVPATGVITGQTSAAGIYLVQLRASNDGGRSSAVTAPLIVQALAPQHIGSFSGIVERNDSANADLGSSFTLTTTSSGSFTVQVKTGTATKSAKGFLHRTSPQVRVDVGGSQLLLALDAVTGLASGTHGAASANGWRMVWDKKVNPASSHEGYYSVALDLANEEDLEDTTVPHGVGYATFSVLPAGTLKITGKSADGQAIVASANLGPNGQIALYVPMYANKGTLIGSWQVGTDGQGLFINNEVSGTATWLKPATKGLAYPAAFGPVNLLAKGGYLSYAAKGTVVVGLPDFGTFGLNFEGGGAEASETQLDVAGIGWSENYAITLPASGNAGKVTLKLDKATGAVSGTFALKETTPALERKGVKFQGQVVRMPGGQVKAVGYFLLPQIPATGQKPNAAPILSGAMLIRQPEGEP